MALPVLKDYIYLNKLGLSVLGVWPLSEDTSTCRVVLQRLSLLLTYTLLLSLFVPQLLDLFVFWGNVDANIENLCINLTCTTVIAKLTNVVLMRDSFKESLATLRSNWHETMSSSVPTKHRDILLRNATLARSFSRIYFGMLCVTSVMYFALPVRIAVNQSATIRQYPFRAWYYFDQRSDFFYNFFYVSQMIVGCVCGCGNFSMDSIFLIMVYHVCAQLCILQSEIRDLCIEETCLASEREVLRKLKLLVRKHEMHIRNAQKLEALFNRAIMQQLLVSCVIICVIGFKLIVAMNSDALGVPLYVSYMLQVLLQILLYCWPGDELINQSIKVGRATYECEWTRLPVSASRYLLLMNLRSQRPLVITGGKFFVMSMPNFTSILKTSLSYLSLLRAINADD